MGEGGFTHLFSFFCWLLPKLMGSMADFQRVKGFRTPTFPVAAVPALQSFTVTWFLFCIPFWKCFLWLGLLIREWSGIRVVVGFLSLPFWSSILLRRSSVGFGSGSFLTHLSSSLLIFIKVEHTDTPNTGIRGIKLIVIHFPANSAGGAWKVEVLHVRFLHHATAVCYSPFFSHFI